MEQTLIAYQKKHPDVIKIQDTVMNVVYHHFFLGYFSAEDALHVVNIELSKAKAETFTLKQVKSVLYRQSRYEWSELTRRGDYFATRRLSA